MNSLKMGLTKDGRNKYSQLESIVVGCDVLSAHEPAERSSKPEAIQELTNTHCSEAAAITGGALVVGVPESLQKFVHPYWHLLHVSPWSCASTWSLRSRRSVSLPSFSSG